jgi:glucose/arabinose dehydrogenase
MRSLTPLFAALLFIAGCTAITLPFGLVVNFAGTSGEPLPAADLAQRIKLPEGFSIGYYAVGIDNARMLRFTDGGDLLVSSTRDGKVYLLARDLNADGQADGVRVLLEGLNRPHGLALDPEFLYVAEADAVLRTHFDQQAATTDGAPERIIKDLPDDGRHWTKTIDIGPDGYLYVAVGSSCNVCVEDNPMRAAISRYDRDGTDGRIYATGLRNAVGFAWQPGTLAMYATDNGRDLLGDDFPPCELDKVVDGGFYGWPYANGNRIPDPDLGSDIGKVTSSLPPVHGFEPHTAPLGITFYKAAAFPARYRGAAFVALHGSWNRSTKIGYEVVALMFDADGKVTEEKFASGFEADDEVFGRPVDVAVGPDGALYVSDDFTDSIYRIAYRAAATATTAPPAPEKAPPPEAAAGEIDPRLRHVALQRGRQLWAQNGCGSCHEKGAEEQFRPLDGLRRKYDINSLMHYLQAPQPPMPLFTLSDWERHDLSIFLLDRYP